MASDPMAGDPMTPANGPAAPRIMVTPPPLPPGWHDKTMVIHAAPPQPDGAAAPNVVISRDMLGFGESFAGYCRRQDELFRGQLPGFELFDEREGSLHGLPALRREFGWQSPSGPLRQQASFIDAGGGVVVTVTATALANAFEAERDRFNAALAGLRIARDGG